LSKKTEIHYVFLVDFSPSMILSLILHTLHTVLLLINLEKINSGEKIKKKEQKRGRERKKL